MIAVALLHNIDLNFPFIEADQGHGNQGVRRVKWAPGNLLGGSNVAFLPHIFWKEIFYFLERNIFWYTDQISWFLANR